MRTAKKYIGILFLWMAGLIILAHSFIPHHHHFYHYQNEQSCCHAEHGHQVESADHSIFSCLHEDADHETCTGCEFSTETTSPLSKISIDASVCANQPNLFFHFSSDRKKLVAPVSYTYSQFYLETGSLRGPPTFA